MCTAKPPILNQFLNLFLCNNIYLYLLCFYIRKTRYVYKILENSFFFVLGLSINLTKFGKENAHEFFFFTKLQEFHKCIHIHVCIYSKKILKGSKHS